MQSQLKYDQSTQSLISSLFPLGNIHTILKICIYYHLYLYFSSSFLNLTNITHSLHNKHSSLGVSYNQKQVIQEFFKRKRFFSSTSSNDLYLFIILPVRQRRPILLI